MTPDDVDLRRNGIAPIREPHLLVADGCTFSAFPDGSTKIWDQFGLIEHRSSGDSPQTRRLLVAAQFEEVA